MDSSAFLQSLKQAKQSAPDAVKSTMRRAADECLQLAKTLCPVDTGNLASSGLVREVDNGYEVVFSAPYAAAVHERTDQQHTNGGPKFLERAFLQVAPDIPDKSSFAIGESLGKLG